MACGAFITVACSDQTGPKRPLLGIAAGDGQHAAAGSELPEPLVVELRDAAQHPMAGARLTWSVSPGVGDVIRPETETTDAEGIVRARWQLDGSTGLHKLLVVAEGGARAQARAYADASPVVNVHALSIATYDGSGQAVHPDFVRIPATWNGDPFRLVATPYPGGDASYENPSLYTGSTGTSWAVPHGLQNPLERPSIGSYLSDPDMVYDPDARELRVYYRRVTSNNEIWMIRSSNGVVWSTPLLTLQAPNHLIVSPTIVRRSGNEWFMWSVNSGAIGCGASTTTVERRTSADGVSWSAPEKATISDPDGSPWHIDVEWIPSRNEYWAVYPVKVSGGCTTDRLRFATSADGLHWTTYPSPILLKGVSQEMHDIVYRSTIDFDPVSGIVTIWYSGATFLHSSYNWRLAWERMTPDALLARVNTAATASLRMAESGNALPPLTNETAP